MKRNCRPRATAAGDQVGSSDLRAKKKEMEPRSGICGLGLLSGRPFYQLRCPRGFGDVTVPHLRKNRNGGVGTDASFVLWLVQHPSKTWGSVI